MKELIKYLPRERLLTVAMLLGAAVALISGSFASFAEQCESFPDRIFRLHILANSDSDADQGLKYALRDYLLSDLADVFDGCTDAQSAKNVAKEQLPAITEKAQQFVYASGYDYTVTASVENIYFTTRSYGSFTAPAGNYDALRILIGAGSGRNWWCVMFPPLCLPAASKTDVLNESAQTDLRFLGSRRIYRRAAPVTFTVAESVRIESGEGAEVRFAVFEAIKGWWE